MCRHMLTAHCLKPDVVALCQLFPMLFMSEVFKIAGAPPIKKHFYQEDPEVAGMSSAQVEDIR